MLKIWKQIPHVDSICSGGLFFARLSSGRWPWLNSIANLQTLHAHLINYSIAVVNDTLYISFTREILILLSESKILSLIISSLIIINALLNSPDLYSLQWKLAFFPTKQKYSIRRITSAQRFWYFFFNVITWLCCVFSYKISKINRG